ncbi:ankyrin repeat-containing protein At2g01680-like [Andrographis paniculata]|uniref:ankyrin repeat-containing protein At2g01680-like n=1 Tax=Andrographis paniculata TaxID=175694 RepID=UPI0021E76C1F|nr:ankyrin repeat-containing protein At2g01680-like [Andrographis paniculata]
MKKLQNKLYEAATEGSVASLRELLEEDALILERDDYVAEGFLETPLHVAAMLGNADFVREMVRIKPQLTAELDSQQSIPLHLASSKGHVDVVRALLSADPRASLARDRNGFTPLHLAAVRGRLEVIKVLLREKVDAAQLRIHRGAGENILHLCVKHYQLEALKLLLNKACGRELINAKDADGNTLLHLAIAYKQVETVEFLLAMPALDVKARNLGGMTATDVFIGSRCDIRDVHIQESLKKAGALGAKDQRAMDRSPSSFLDHHLTSSSIKKSTRKHQDDWLEKKRSALMIVASLIATIAYQVGVNPPGGVWQDDNLESNSKSIHVAGISIMARNNPVGYTKFYIVNTISFISSLSIILLLTSGLPIKRRFFVWILMVITWIAITATAVTYISVLALLAPPSMQDNYVLYVIGISVVVWVLLMALLLLGHTIRLIIKLFKKMSRTLRRRRVANPTIDSV